MTGLVQGSLAQTLLCQTLLWLTLCTHVEPSGLYDYLVTKAYFFFDVNIEIICGTLEIKVLKSIMLNFCPFLFSYVCMIYLLMVFKFLLLISQNAKMGKFLQKYIILCISMYLRILVQNFESITNFVLCLHKIHCYIEQH